MTELKGHESWAYYDTNLSKKASGTGMSSLKSKLKDDECGFALFRIDAKNVGNAGPNVVTQANIILVWKGEKTKGMARMKHQSNLQSALSKLTPNKGFLEVLTKGPNLSVDAIFDCWKPGSGSKVIQ